MNVKVMGLVAACGLALASVGHAATLATYTFTGANASGGGSAGVADSSSNGTAGAVTAGPGLTTASGGSINFQTRGYANSTVEADWNQDYVSFSFTPSSVMSFTTLTFTTDREASGSPKQLVVRSNLTGSTNLYSANPGASTATEPHSVPLNVAGLTNVAASTNVVFQIFGFDATSTAADVALDDVVLSGEPGGIPEPASIGLVALGATALIRRRRA